MGLAKRLGGALVLAGLFGTTAVWSQQRVQPFVVRYFRVEGAQRISDGTVYNYLPINIGDMVTQQRVAEAIRALYATGFFEDVKLKTSGLMARIKSENRYSKEGLQGDPEVLRSYYMDRGFADFRLDNAQVSVSPNKRNIYITISISEGERYKISSVELAGKLAVPAKDLKTLILAQPGQIFSQQILSMTEDLMKTRLGRDGYADADVQAVPDLNRKTKEVAVTFFVQPKNRVYVRHINFKGVGDVDDEVLRREMRQMEGGYLSKPLLERSKTRLQRLPYVKSVDYETAPVPGSPDQVDVDFNIEERQAQVWP